MANGISTTSRDWYDAANWDTGSNGLGGADIGNVNITLASDNLLVNGSFEEGDLTRAAS